MSISRRTVDWRKVWRDVTNRVGQLSWEFDFTQPEKQAIKKAVDAQVEAIVDDLTALWSTRALNRKP